MASKKQTDSPARPNRIRFVMLEADLNDNNLSELTQAITSALRPAAPLLPPRASGPLSLKGAVAPSGNGSAITDEPDDVEVGAEAEPEEIAPAAPSTPKGPRKVPRTPKYLPALFTKEAGAEFQKFATARPTEDHSARYLVAAMWLKDHGEESVNIDKVYTCYKTAPWPTNFEDWGISFRNHVARTRKMERVGNGEYRITPLGEAAVDELKTK